jgi:DNA-binding beta-propeller fold protein YncE
MHSRDQLKLPRDQAFLKSNLFLNPLVHTRLTPRGASLVVSDPHFPFFIFEQALEEGEVVTVAGTGSSGFVDGAGDSAQFYRPIRVAMSPDGTYALVAEYWNHVIRKIMIATQVVSTFAGTGSSGFVNGVGDSAKFNGPIGVAISPDGTYALVADYGNHVIRKIMIATQVVSTFAGTGSSGLVNGAGDSAQFKEPIDVAMSPDGTYALVTDFSNHVIRAVGTAS